ncbi:MAG: cytidylate kinase-like family protein, partial [Lachnospiraceae bacterium]|nr:cytidylate kinase-like family protein [Lachnospiraceae bacterium]
CVIVGRCADYALEDYPNCLKIFIHADEAHKLARIMKRQNVDEGKARDLMAKTDKKRQSYYNYYSSKKWGRADSYDLTVNSSILGIEGTVNLIAQFVDDFEAKK